MDINARQQRLAFAVIVVLLAGIGVYLLLPKATSRPHPATSPPSPTTAPATAAAPAPTAAAPIATPSAAPSGTVDIFQWLPFTQADLANAVAVVTKAAGYYDTFRYDENASTYGNRLSNLVTSQFLQVLEEDYSTYGVAKQRIKDKEISSASAMINSIRAFGQSSLTFVVTITQNIRNVTGTTSPASQFAITAIKSGDAWQVDQIQPASAGNQ